MVELHTCDYGICKVGATFVASGTTLPISIPSGVYSGEWSMFQVIQVYWYFSEPGDCYLGRFLGCVYPNWD